MAIKRKPRKKTPPAAGSRQLVPLVMVERRICVIRGQKVMVDRDLADLYQVETKALNRAVSRNLTRFPEDFMFQLTTEEAENLRCQFGTSSWGGRRYLPHAFTEHGAVMLASVLNSKRAMEMSIVVVRAFIMLREVMATNRDLARKIEDLERGQKEHGRHIAGIYDAVNKLIAPKPGPARRIGYPVPTGRAR